MLQRKNLLEQFKERLEPSVAGPTIVNDGSIFMALGIWYEHVPFLCIAAGPSTEVNAAANCLMQLAKQLENATQACI